MRLSGRCTICQHDSWPKDQAKPDGWVATPTELTANELMEIVGSSIPGFREAFRAGSRETVFPPPVETDLDIVVLVQSVNTAGSSLIDEHDWATPGNWDEYKGTGDTFITVRWDSINLLIFEDVQEFGAMRAMTTIAKALNLRTKEERYKLFETGRLTWRDR